MSTTYVYRSSVTGKFVKPGYAKRYPHLTVRSRVKPLPKPAGRCEHHGQAGKRKCENCGKRLPRLCGNRNNQNKYNF